MCNMLREFDDRLCGVDSFAISWPVEPSLSPLHDVEAILLRRVRGFFTCDGVPREEALERAKAEGQACPAAPAEPPRSSGRLPRRALPG